MPTIVHFNISADDVERARKFYEGLFYWKWTNPPGMTDYYLIETKDLHGNKGVSGGMGKRNDPDENITNFIGVNRVEEYVSKVKKLGGKVVQPKMAIPGWGYLVICLDTENNTFGLWEGDTDAK